MIAPQIQQTFEHSFDPLTEQHIEYYSQDKTADTDDPPEYTCGKKPVADEHG